jgi:ribosomal protein L37AE/L43A
MNAWILLSKPDALRGPETYGDEEFVYRYDSKVPNFKQLLKGDVAFVTDLRTRVSVATLADIVSEEGLKRLDRCPKCGRTSQVRIAAGGWRCSACKLRYAVPTEEQVQVIRFEAHLANVAPLDDASRWISLIKSSTPPKQQNSIRRLQPELMDPEVARLVNEQSMAHQVGPRGTAILASCAEAPYIPSTPEGRRRLISHFRIERSAAAAKDAKERYLASNPLGSCEACGFSFIKMYGDHGAGYVEAHHRIPLSLLAEPAIPSRDDFAMVCANCHRMLHRTQGSTMTVDELRSLIKST